MNREIIITGGDARFFPFLSSALASLRAHRQLARRPFGIIDQGLLPEQCAMLEALGCTIVKPEWTLPVPEAQRHLRNIGLVARTALRDYFPGYGVYLWFDADAWAQTPDFAEAFIAGALEQGAAVALENGPGYRRPFTDLKWWAGNMVAAFGAVAGARLSFAPSVNIGVLCLTDTAPHWDAWVRAYTRALNRTGKVNLDQHAFLAAVHQAGLPTSFLPARNNWLPHLSCPLWNAATGQLCEPVAPYRPVSVIHLAGPDKTREYVVPTTTGETLVTPLTFAALEARTKSIEHPLPALAATRFCAEL